MSFLKLYLLCFCFCQPGPGVVLKGLSVIVISKLHFFGQIWPLKMGMGFEARAELHSYIQTKCNSPPATRTLELAENLKLQGLSWFLVCLRCPPPKKAKHYPCLAHTFSNSNSRCCCNKTLQTAGCNLDYFYPYFIQEISKVVFKKIQWCNIGPWHSTHSSTHSIRFACLL